MSIFGHQHHGSGKNDTKKLFKAIKQNLSKREENRHLHNKIFYTGPVRYVYRYKLFNSVQIM
jgi:hypothetical protein